MTPAAVPRVGLLATVRNRHGVVAAVQPFDGEGGRLHLVHLEYKDAGQPADERLLWELETGARLVEPSALPDPAQAAMPPADFDALLRAARWGALVPYLDPRRRSLRRTPLASPFHGAVQVENHQQGPLFDEADQLAASETLRRGKRHELARRRRHYDELREQLQRERTRVLEHVLPKRFALAGTAQVFR